MTTNTHNTSKDSRLEKHMANMVRTMKLKYFVNYLFYAVAAFSAFMYADSFMSLVTNQIIMH